LLSRCCFLSWEDIHADYRRQGKTLSPALWPRRRQAPANGLVGGKAAEGSRTPKRFALIEPAGRSARFWSAPALWRFQRGIILEGYGSLIKTR
jgi:hypothetical protein